MSWLIKCDHCGKTEATPFVEHQGKHVHKKPAQWYQRQDRDGIFDVCSLECAKAWNEKTGKDAEVVK